MSDPSGTWNQVSGAGIPTADWNAICYGDGKFVMVGNYVVSGSVYGCYSTDSGSTWQLTNAISSNSAHVFQGIAYGNGVFIAVCSGETNAADTIKRSADGITWSSITSFSGTSYTSPNMYAVAYGQNNLGIHHFVTVGTARNIFYSTDGGENWTGLTRVTTTGGYRSLCYYSPGEYFLAPAYTNTDGTVISISTSPPELSTNSNALPNNQKTSIAYGNISSTNYLICVATSSGSGSNNRIQYSTDGGASFTSASAGLDTNLINTAVYNGVTFGNETFVAVGSTSGYNVVYSTDAINWNANASVPALSWKAIAYTDDIYIATSTASDSIITNGEFVCFVRGTRILCISEETNDHQPRRQWVPIERLSLGDKVMVYEGEEGTTTTRRIAYIGTQTMHNFRNLDGRPSVRTIYRHKQWPNFRATGGHSVYVPPEQMPRGSVGDGGRDAFYLEKDKRMMYGLNMLLICDSSDFEPVQEEGDPVYSIYHLCLESATEEDDIRHHIIYAGGEYPEENGVLTETLSLAELKIYAKHLKPYSCH